MFNLRRNLRISILLAMLAMWDVHAPAAGPDAKAPVAGDVFQLAGPGAVKLTGRLGDQIGQCEKHCVWGRDAERFVAILRNKNDRENWRGEYWGKWYTAAALAYACGPTAEHLAQLKENARDVVKTQDADGYIGPYAVAERLQVWDIWCRKYVELGLITAYDLTSDKTFLDAACRNADNLIDDLAKRKLRVIDVGVSVLKGTANSSIIEPMALLYQRTGEAKYLQFAQSILASWNTPSAFAPEGIHLLDDALANKPPLKNHAYSIMSCFEGVCELYRGTGDRKYLDAAVRFGQSVRRHERMINGGVSNQELFFDGVRNQTEILEQPQETCAIVTWMKLCVQLLRLTGDPIWADEMELSLYNAMIGTLTPGGDYFSYFTPLVGERIPSFIPHTDLNMSCCVASGPRGLLLTPRWAVMTAADGPVVNLYAPGSATIQLAGGATVQIVQQTDYPVGDEVKLTITPDRKQRFTLRLRIPAWSKKTSLAVNGEASPCEVGQYAKLDREWSAGDQVVLKLDLRGRAIPAPSGAPQFALMRGPILLAMDNRLIKADDEAVHLLADAEGYVDLKPSATKPDWAWMAFDAPFRVRPSHFFNHRTVNLAMCDMASAGNAWSETNLYRVWLPQPLLLSNAFVANTWKLTPLIPGPGRPTIPSAATGKGK